MNTRSPLAAAIDGVAPEVTISRDLVRRGLIAAPVLIAVSGVVWGLDGALSGAFALALVLLNFALAALLIAWTAPVSLSLMMGAILGGYLVRLGIITGAVLLVKDFSWVDIPALGTGIIVSHLGLLFWEMRYVAASLAFPGLRPRTAECPEPGAPDSDRRTDK